MLKEKKSKRKAMLAQLAKIDKKERIEISAQLQQNLFETGLWKKAQKIGVYLSMEIEWDTYNIVEQALEEGKKVAIPKTIANSKELIFYQIDDLSQTVEGNFGLIEPDPEKARVINKDEFDFLIVPGLVFSQNGYRVGFGGGYYDRFLSDFIAPTISLVHTNQIVEQLPIEHFDIPINYLLTEKGWLR